MRIDRVVARAFGPFQGDVLELAPGMTVVAGPNESGKSSWHAALRLAVTGVRRGKGPGTSAERQLSERHRPWDQPERWEVEARLSLDDGRLIDISQDLGGKVACRAVDVALGRDVSNEIMDGTPDASRWLGLDRDAFAATVSVGQAQILAVADAAEDLQEQMQRAAATRGTDATAAEAIARLEAFRRDAVGADTVAAKGPLRTAKNRQQAAAAALQEARQLHADYLERGARHEEAERLATEAHLRLAGAEAARARYAAADTAARVSRAAALSARHPQPPVSVAARDELQDRVAAVLESWRTRPEPPPLTGRTADEIREEIEQLPQAPVADTSPHPTVTEAGNALAVAVDAARLLGERPSAPEPIAPGWEPAQLRDLARRLRNRQLPQAAALEAELARLRSIPASRPRGPAFLAGGLAALSAIAAAIVLATEAPILAAGLFALAIVAGAAAFWIGRGDGSVRARIAHAEAALAPYRFASAEAIRDREEAERVARDAGLPTEAAQLDDLADRALAAGQTAAAALEWERRQSALQSRRRAAADALRAALRERGESVPDDADPTEILQSYLLACGQRAAQQRDADRAEILRAELAARLGAEKAASVADERRAAIVAALRSAAAELQLVADEDPEMVAAALEAWRSRRGAELQAYQQAQAEWQQLQTLLDGGTLADLEAEAARRRQRATELAAALPPGAVTLPETTDPEGQLAALRAEDERLRREVDHQAGALAERRDALPDVAEAEEAAEAATRELRRVEALAQSVDTTLRLLRAAEERVHRDLAPILGQAVARWLPSVSQGRYSEISVDPSDLAVRVKEASSGQWRNARLLSEGTREQIYLLLRVAMAEHLVTTGERAPLLLDEVTVQSDGERKRQLLEVLHRLSGERQVILFSHDDDVLAWAETSLHEPDDRLVRLAPMTASIPVPMATDAVDLVPLAPVPLAD
jgi:recombinational DNA repair ATPase RecF